MPPPALCQNQGAGGPALDPALHLHYGSNSPYRKETHMIELAVLVGKGMVIALCVLVVVDLVATVATKAVIRTLKEHGR